MGSSFGAIVMHAFVLRKVGDAIELSRCVLSLVLLEHFTC